MVALLYFFWDIMFPAIEPSISIMDSVWWGYGVLVWSSTITSTTHPSEILEGYIYTGDQYRIC